MLKIRGCASLLSGDVISRVLRELEFPWETPQSSFISTFNMHGRLQR
jgi:hypothetical protein